MLKNVPARAVKIIITLLLILSMLLSGASCKNDEKNSVLTVSFIDVGQGDCSLIQCGDVSILVDGGDESMGPRVVRYLKDAGVSEISCYVLTHPHSDHIGCSAYIIENFTVKQVFLTAFSETNMPTTAVYEKTLTAISEVGAEPVFVTAGGSYSFGELGITVLSPSKEYDDYNDMSVVFRLTYKNHSFLFMGDATKNVEADILASGAELKSDVLKVGHHGSSSSTGEAFLAAVLPAYAVISCGNGNNYGHPHSETVSVLRSYGAQIFRTDNDGTVVIRCDDCGIAAEAGK